MFAFLFGIIAMVSVGTIAVTAPNTMSDTVCNAKAEEVAAATTNLAQDSMVYQMDFLGKKQDAYKICMDAKNKK